jgi:hypothetical protein
LVLFVLIPWLALPVLCLGLNGIVVDKTLEIWWELPSSPGARHHQRLTTVSDRCLNFNLHFLLLHDDWFFGDPPANRRRTISRAIRWTLPAPDAFAGIHLAVSSLLLIHVAVSWVLIRLACAFTERIPNRWGAAVRLTAALSPFYTAAVLGACIFALLGTVSHLVDSIAWSVLGWGLVVLFVLLLLASGWFCIRIIRSCRPPLHGFTRVFLSGAFVTAVALPPVLQYVIVSLCL